MTILSKETVGAWLLHHDQKLNQVQSVAFEAISMAGRSARLLSVISKEKDRTIDAERIQVLANGLGIRRHEISGLLDELSKNGLIDRNQAGVRVLAVSQQSLLNHAANLFSGQNPNGLEIATLDLAERGSHTPIRRTDCEEELRDIYKLSKSEADDLFSQSEEIGFTDYEGNGQDRLYFNGSLFKRDQAKKAKFLLENLKPEEIQKLNEADALFQKNGCVPANHLRHLLGASLWTNLHQIAYFDVVMVKNEVGITEFATKPDAISKFMPSGLADMLDDAKALAAGLTYGMVKSTHARGRIRDPNALMNVFLGQGYLEGRVTALVQDYKPLEKRGVVTVTDTSKGYRMTIEKPEVGRMARELILRGDANMVASEVAVGQSASHFAGPEAARLIERRKPVAEAQSQVSRSLNILRKS